MDAPLPLRIQAHSREGLLAFKDRVFCLCLGFVGNAADARDLAQETYVKALAHYDSDRPANPQAWILRIARNTCLDLARRRKARGPQVPVSPWSAMEHDTPERRAGREDEIAIVRRAIARLPRRLRDVLVMREYGELSYQEIAQALRIGPGTVMSRLSRARAAVLRFYQEEHHGKSG
ncbi:MAG: RNA polymerase sigma factor [Candidatus Aminicenantes bacterium]|nr:RNA polymerase sigma factor [Candidatus Aminicenantes bacterium]